MKFIVSALFALVTFASAGGPGGPGGGLMGHVMDILMGPPKSMNECLDRMQLKTAMKFHMFEAMMETKWDCKDQCLPDEQKACFPIEKLKTKMMEEHNKIKEAFMEAKGKARKCLEDKVGSGCDNEPKRYGMCGVGMFMKMIGDDVKDCAGDCMMNKIKFKVIQFVAQNAGKNGFPTLEEFMGLKEKMMKMKGMMMNGKGKGKGKGKGRMIMQKMAMMMTKKMMGPCITQFCDADVLHQCAEEGGLIDAMKMKKMKKMEIMKMMEDEMFPKSCECLKKTATNLPEYLQSFDCARKPNMEVCGLLHVDYVDQLGKKFEEKMGGPELASRRKREIQQALDMAEQIDLLDAFDFE